MTTAIEVVAALRASGLTVATAESLTGGLVCAALTDVPGSSAVVRGSVVAYATDLKSGVLGVDAGLLAAGGAVQADVAGQMATGVCRVLGSDVGVATTGVAGPQAQDGRTVGTVFLAVALAGQVHVRELAIEGDRTAIRRQSVDAALSLVADAVGGAIKGAEESPGRSR